MPDGSVSRDQTESEWLENGSPNDVGTGVFLFSETCPDHRNSELAHLNDLRLGWIFGINHIAYCPDIACSFVIPRNSRGNPSSLHEKDLLLLQQETFLRKFVAQFVGNGK